MENANKNAPNANAYSLRVRQIALDETSGTKPGHGREDKHVEHNHNSDKKARELSERRSIRKRNQHPRLHESVCSSGAWRSHPSSLKSGLAQARIIARAITPPVRQADKPGRKLSDRRLRPR
jgi:hypothetical protein